MIKKNKKVPVILQMETLECGATCLAMILAFYGRYIPLEQLRLECGVSRDGSKAKDILIAGRHNGLEAKGYKYSIEKLKELKTFPVIIHWDFNHFVVLVGFKNNKAIINDPATGRVEVSMDKFEKSYTGVTLVFKPAENFEKCGTPRNNIKFLIENLKGYKIPLLFIIVIGIMISIIGIFSSIFSKIYTDYILLAKSLEWIYPLVLAMFITLVIMIILKIIQTEVLIRIKAKMNIDLNIKFLWHTLRLPVEFFSQRSVGDISQRQLEISEITNILFDKLVNTLISFVMIVMYFFILAYLDLKMALISLVMVVINIMCLKNISKRNENYNKSSMRDYGKLSGSAMAGISMIETIKASGAEQGYFEKLSGYQAKYNNSLNSLKEGNLFLSVLPNLLSELCNAIILILGIGNILDGKFTIGMLISFQGFLSSFFTPINDFVEIFANIQKMNGQIDRLDDVIKYKEDVNIDISKLDFKESNIKYQKLNGDIELKNVSFAYNSLGDLLIENFSLKIEKGQMIALVGGSGSGKSTIAQLIAGLYKVRDGEILYDGIKQNEIDRYIFTNSVSLVDQNITIFKDTIRNNITLWNDDIDEETLVKACKDACIYDEIMMRAEGFNYIMEEGGKNFSGGQRQRIEIARAFVNNPSIIILDEATSALDTVTEQKIMEAIKCKNITCIIIAHRLSTIRDADLIIMLKYGKEIERGKHNELIKIPNGNYVNLIKNE